MGSKFGRRFTPGNVDASGVSYFAQFPDGQRRKRITIDTPSQSVRSLIQAEPGTHPGARGLAPKHVGRKDIDGPKARTSDHGLRRERRQSIWAEVVGLVSPTCRRGVLRVPNPAFLNQLGAADAIRATAADTEDDIADVTADEAMTHLGTVAFMRRFSSGRAVASHEQGSTAHSKGS